MSNLVTFPSSPYFDSFDPAKKFLRTLFRPGYVVQTRELNELQSMLQDQVGTLGSVFFQNGQSVIGGQLTVNPKQAFIKLMNPLARSANSEYEGLTISNLTNTLSAKIVKVVRSNLTDPDTLYLEYTGTSTADNSTSSFAAGENLILTHADLSQEQVIVLGDSSAVGFGSTATVQAGIYFILDQFVRVDQQVAVISKYTSVLDIPETKIGLEVVQSIVTPEIDTDLLDNALGSPNETAPGAHRFKLEALLKVIGDANIESYINVLTLLFGVVQTPARPTDTTVFEDILAARTFDESGDYIVDPFLLEVREDFDDGTNRGLSVTGNADKIGYVLDPGRAYVRGYQVDTRSNTILQADKARTTASENELLVSSAYNASFVVNTVVNQPVLFSKINLRNGATVIGTAFVKSFAALSTTTYQLEFFALSMNPGQALTSVTVVAGVTNSFTANVSSFRYDPRQSSMLYSIPFGFVKQVSELEYTHFKLYTTTVNGTSATITTATNDQFYGDTASYVVTIGGVTKQPNGVTRSVGNTQATLDISNFTTPSGTVTVIAKTLRGIGNVRTKSLQTITETYTSANSVVLTKTDGVELVSITLGGNDITSAWAFDGGQRDTHYDFARLTFKSGTAPVGTLTVTYKHFQHGVGDFFAAQSYENIDYGLIPYYTNGAGQSIFLGSAIDFRPDAIDGNSFQMAGSNAVASSIDMQANFSYYLSRIDKICLDKTGFFSVVQGVPAVNPAVPNDVADGITLYTVNVPAYTFKVADIRATQIPHRRYTMDDIGRLETRISNVEKTTALSLLESTANAQVTANAFKSGFVVDSFQNQNVVEQSIDSQVCFDFDKAELRPIILRRALALAVKAGSTGFAINNGVMTLPFTEVTAIEQNLASRVERVQPYALNSWEGNVSLVPNFDNWTSTVAGQDFVLDGGALTLAQFQQIQGRNPELVSGTSWNSLRGWVGVGATLGNTVVDTGNDIVTYSSIPFIRERVVDFTATGLKPFTRVRAYFDFVDVGAHVRPNGGSFGDALITGGSGSVSGQFRIPNNEALKFRTGIRKFVIADSSTIPSDNQTYTETLYTATGTLATTHNVKLSTRIINDFPRNFGDPLAQSFYFQNDGGAFITSVDLYFGPDASSNQDSVFVELRGMTNGYPNTEVLAIAARSASEVVGSADASASTRFTFPNPVYLQQEVEYCFVIRSNSTSLTVWLAQMGDKSRNAGDTSSNTGQIISKQPYMGVLFKSSQNTTWSPEQTQDLKFKINRASFNINAAQNIVLTNTISADNLTTETNPYRRALGFDPFQFTSTSTSVVVRDVGHSFRVGDIVALSGSQTGSLNGVPVTQIYGNRTITAVTVDSYTFVVTTPATSTGSSGGSGNIASGAVEFSSVFLNSNEVVLNGTSVSYGIKAFDRAANALDGNFAPFVSNSTKYLGSTKVSKASGDNTVQISVAMSSTAENISPVIDLSSADLIAIKNYVSNDAESLVSNTGAAARYVQKTVNLETPANSITVYADVNRPAASTVEVFYKVGQSDPSQQATWVQMPVVGSAVVNENPDTFAPYTFAVTGLTEFYAAKIKIVIRSSNEAKVAKLKNLRTLLLDI